MITLIGSLAGLLTTACWLPQMVKTMRLGAADEFAWPYLGMLTVGLSAWIAYGFLRHDPPIYICNVVTFALVLVVAAVKVRAERARALECATVTEVAALVAEGAEG
ncbi:MAG TPA: PQ-loop domain-containing transporter [Acidimicrobiales bacterium]|nr:PQ-loop domain-containing transporter [Acidimicrobiales bacterium]